jgi:hypothetical protein
MRPPKSANAASARTVTSCGLHFCIAAPSAGDRGRSPNHRSLPRAVPMAPSAQDYDFLKKAGVAAIYGPGTNIPAAAAAEILAMLRQRSHKRSA